MGASEEGAAIGENDDNDKNTETSDGGSISGDSEGEKQNVMCNLKTMFFSLNTFQIFLLSEKTGGEGI